MKNASFVKPFNENIRERSKTTDEYYPFRPACTYGHGHVLSSATRAIIGITFGVIAAASNEKKIFKNSHLRRFGRTATIFDLKKNRARVLITFTNFKNRSKCVTRVRLFECIINTRDLVTPLADPTDRATRIRVHYYEVRDRRRACIYDNAIRTIYVRVYIQRTAP